MSVFMSLLKREIIIVSMRPFFIIFSILFVFFMSLSGINVIENGWSNYYFFLSYLFAMMFFVPLVASDGISKEWQTLQAEFIFSLPISVVSFVLDKFISLWLICLAPIVLTLPVYFIMYTQGNTPANPSAIDDFFYPSAYVSVILATGVLCSFCVFISSLYKDKLMTFITCFVLCGLSVVNGLPLVQDSVALFFSPVLNLLLSVFSLTLHVQNGLYGVFSLSETMYLIASMVIFLSLSCLIVDARKG